MEQLETIEAQLQETPDKQISLTDPDARSMATSDRDTGMMPKGHKSVTTSRLPSTPNITLSLPMRSPTLVMTVTSSLTWRHRPKARRQLLNSMPSPTGATSGAKADGRFGREHFEYHPKQNQYSCLAGERLKWRCSIIERDMTLHRYWSSSCQQCALKAKFTPDKQRKVTRWEHEDILEAMQKRLDLAPESMRIRRETVEHPFGTLKSWMGYTHFLTKTIDRVSTEMSLHVLAYNLKRVIKILGMPALMEAMVSA